MSDGRPGLTSPQEQPTFGPAVGPVTAGHGTQASTVGSGGDPGPASFGDYALLAELGRGGMGIVFKASQASLHRTVAVKMLLPNAVASASELLRFRTEVEATACLRHPHIVRVHQVGEIDGRPYYSMDFIDGPSLTQRVAEGPLAGKVAARYLATIARAIHHAHGQGILHRDLKPSNILLDADDQPHVTDFGLAKRLGGDARQTRTGTILGTPSYMAPEQAAGSQQLTPAVDIYGLGALLYELLTGRPPFRAETPLDTLVQVLECAPAPPRLLNPNVERDVETICLKCLEKDPRRRYASAEALAVDLERYQAGEAISARNLNLVDRLVSVLERSQYDVQFRTYGTLLFGFAVIVMLWELGIALIVHTQQPFWLLVLAQASRILLLVQLVWYVRPSGLWPTSVAERQMWSIWIGYATACATVGVANRLVAGWSVALELTQYPPWAAATGLAFFVMGNNYWGWCYAFGLAFCGLALVMTLDLRWAPIEFGALWAAVFTVIGVRLHAVDANTPRGAKPGNAT
jgi:hypothetical protein